jgi:ferrous iron transport protein B
MRSEVNYSANQASNGVVTATSRQNKDGNNNVLTIALAGNANVGKSAIFNQLTGLVQETGNWAGKTVSLKEGTLLHHGLRIRMVDLPGIYSFSTYSPEELISRDYILTKHPDVVINVVDATSLERNLYFTLQLKEMGVPLVISLNLTDVAKKKHIEIDLAKLSRILDSPVIETIAVKGIGVHELIDEALKVAESKIESSVSNDLRYGPEIEQRISEISNALAGTGLTFPQRWFAIKLLEGDNKANADLNGQFPEIIQLSQKLSAEIAGIHGEDCTTVIASERYALAAKIAENVSIHPEEVKRSLTTKLDNISLHPITGYILLFTTMLAILIFISFFGGWLTRVITGLFESINPHTPGLFSNIFWNGAVTGFAASLSIAVGFILPFYVILGVLSDCGYLPRVAFMMDRPCHLIGLHGQATMPLILALGCNVPACLACRILENRRDRLLATFISTMVPCSARTSVVLGLVGAFIGWQWAVALMVFQFVLIFVVGRVLNRLSPSTSPGIIMEIPEYRIPALRTVVSQAWNRFKGFVILGIPLITVGSAVIQSLNAFNLLDYITRGLSPLTVTWLGLPAFTGVLLIFGILRKEATLALLITLAGGVSIVSIMSPLQMVVFTIVIMLYIPCISTIAVLVKETGFKITTAIVFAEIVLALLVGGIAYRVLGLVIH